PRARPKRRRSPAPSPRDHWARPPAPRPARRRTGHADPRPSIHAAPEAPVEIDERVHVLAHRNALDDADEDGMGAEAVAVDPAAKDRRLCVAQPWRAAAILLPVARRKAQREALAIREQARDLGLRTVQHIHA